MRVLVTATQRIGPFNNIYATATGWIADGEVEFPSSVVGEAHIEDALESDFPAFKPPVPQSVTMRQARIALHRAGLLVDVDAAIASLPSPQKEEAQIEWEFSSTVERSRNITSMLGAALGLSEDELDDLFITASAL